MGVETAQRTLADAIEEAGLGRPKVIGDGKLRRFCAPGDRTANSWYIAHGDDAPAGAFGCWKRGITRRWSNAQWSSARAFTPLDRERIAEENANRARIDAAVKAEAARRAAEIWSDAEPAESHPYLERKRVKPHGARITKDSALIIPARDAEGAIHTLQFIYPDGTKRFLRGGAKRGHFFAIGEFRDRVIIAEGFATGATVHEATGDAVAVAFDAGNLAPVARVIREKYPEAKINIAGDADQVGRTKAEAAAREVDGTVTIPKFTGTREGLTDFNDLAVSEGLDAVRAQLSATIEAADTWPAVTPLPDTLNPVEGFTPELLPEAFRGFVVDAAERIQCPPDFVAASVMVAAGSVIGRQCAIRPKTHDDWAVTPNLWGAIIGAPAVKKTPAMQAALNFLTRLDARAREDFDNKIEAYNVAVEVHSQKLKAAKKAAGKVAEDGGDDDAIRAALDVPKITNDTPTRRRYFTNDCTVEKLGEILAENPNGVLVVRDELTGWLRSFERDGRESDRAFYLEAANGTGRFVYDRIGRGTVEIEAACVSILGGIQPGPLREYFRSAMDSGAGADGLLQRLQLMVWPDISSDFQIVDRWPNTAARDRAFTVFERLANLDTAAELDKYDPIPFLRFAPEAQELFYLFSLDLNRRLRSGNDPEALTSHLAKSERTVAALALIIHVADSSDGGPVSRIALERALGWAEYLESHARRVYGACGRGDLDNARAILRRLEAGELPATFTAKDIYRKCWAGLSRREAVEAALDLLECHGWIKSRKIDTGGRPSVIHTVHPQARRGE